MEKKVLLFLMFFVLAQAAFSTTITVEETEKASLNVKASDPDSANLVYTFSKPLDENGNWQTAYGDAGEYDVTVTVSDGTDSTSQDVKIIVKKKEELPVIDSFSPADEIIEMDEGSSFDFSVEASDLNKDELSYTWQIDDKKVSEAKQYSYKAGYGDAGTHSVSVSVSDSISSVDKVWNVNVKKVDLSYLLDQVNNMEIDETGVVRLNLPMIKSHTITYEVSEPIGNGNYWKTSYEDAGEYEVDVKLIYGPNVNTKKIKVKVNNKDRLPEFRKVGFIKLDEGKKIEITLDADDPDGGAISFSAGGLPEGASFSGNVFKWEPGYGTVNKDSIYNKLLDKFHLANRIFTASFFAESEGAKVEQKSRIIVFDVNRPPVLNVEGNITVDEGEVINIKPEASDPDGDKIKYSYSGWMSSGTYNTTFDDAGEYIVKVAASDGWLEDSKDVKITVNNVNEAPIISSIPKKETNEGKKVEMDINANDNDGDEVIISFSGIKNASIRGNKFTWVPGYDTISTVEGSKDIKIDFTASDSKNSISSKEGIVKVYNVNRAPVIINVTPPYDFIAVKGQQIPLAINAYDPDGDQLVYDWEFGFFDKYKNLTASHIRTFSSLGFKKIKVTVSDGMEKAEHEWVVKVIKQS